MYDGIMDRIKAHCPLQYPGEDVKALPKDFRMDARELDHAGQYDQKLSMHMLDAFLLAGGRSNEEYCLPLHLLKCKLDKELMKVSHMMKQAAKSNMIAQELTFADITNEAEDSYNAQFGRNAWPPAMSIRDMKTPPASFEALACGDVNEPLTAAQLNTLIQTKVNEKVNSALNNGKPKTGNCHNCGQPGHWSCKCPNKQNNAAGGNGCSSTMAITLLDFVVVTMPMQQTGSTLLLHLVNLLVSNAMVFGLSGVADKANAIVGPQLTTVPLTRRVEERALADLKPTLFRLKTLLFGMLALGSLGWTCGCVVGISNSCSNPRPLREKGNTVPMSLGRNPDKAHNQKAINHEMKPLAVAKNQKVAISRSPKSHFL
jgi:hypothetical protein